MVALQRVVSIVFSTIDTSASNFNFFENISKTKHFGTYGSCWIFKQSIFKKEKLSFILFFILS